MEAIGSEKNGLMIGWRGTVGQKFKKSPGKKTREIK